MELFVFLSFALILVAAVFGLRRRFLSFQGQQPSEYLGLGPDLVLHERLSGAMVCDGLVFGPTGRVSSRFRADVRGDWTGREGTVTLDFAFDSGATQLREWRLSLGNDGHVAAEADDIDGRAKGRIVGPTLRMAYRIRLPEDAGGHTLSVVDWIYLTEHGVLVNRSQFRKFGITVAELFAVIRPKEG
ncbi:DUF3833 family protein [Palleronia sediminis]|uniref:DUF3833 family protein n=1 Tax=Palleronia sediminis TaxID=2547833 RepID=UPI001454E477|nr:DUF3833 family protein [Palleronia sediminis]